MAKTLTSKHKQHTEVDFNLETLDLILDRLERVEKAIAELQKRKFIVPKAEYGFKGGKGG